MTSEGWCETWCQKLYTGPTKGHSFRITVNLCLGLSFMWMVKSHIIFSLWLFWTGNNPIYNLLPDILSHLSSRTDISPDHFRSVMQYLISSIDKVDHISNLWMYWSLGPTLLNSIYSCYLLFERENCLICWGVTTNLCVLMKYLISSYDKVDHISWLDEFKSWSDLAQLPSTAVIFCLRGRIVSYVERNDYTSV